MKRWIIVPLLLAAVLVLSGCALGSRRDRAARPTEAPAAAQPAEVAGPAATQTPAAAPTEPEAPTEAPAATLTPEPAAGQPTADDTIGQQAFDQLNALDAANQAGDTLEGLP